MLGIAIKMANTEEMLFQELRLNQMNPIHATPSIWGNFALQAKREFIVQSKIQA